MKTLFSQVISFAKVGDRDWTDAFKRYLDWEERERKRLKDPLGHLLARFDLSSMPFPISILPRSDTWNDNYKKFGIRIRASISKDKDIIEDFEINRFVWNENEDAVIEFVRYKIISMIRNIIENAIIVKENK